MKKILDSNQLTDENIRYTNRVQKDKAKAFALPFLCMLLLILELSLNLILNIDTFIIVILTFILSAFVNVYVIYTLQKTKILLEVIFTADHNNVSIKTLKNMNESEFRKLESVRVSWRSFKIEWLMVVMSCYVCVGVPFASYIINFQ